MGIRRNGNKANLEKGEIGKGDTKNTAFTISSPDIVRYVERCI
jgi:hypothetical protein